MPKLPTFIFADENHFSPFLCDILNKLSPHLHKLGYANFYSETPENKSLGELQQEIAQVLEETKSMDAIFSKIKESALQHSSTYDEFKKYLSTKLDSINGVLNVEYTSFLMMREMLNICEQLGASLSNEDSAEATREGIETVVLQSLKLVELSNKLMLPCTQARLNMLNNIASNNIQLLGVDDASLNESNTVKGMNALTTQLTQDKDFIKNRDRIMAAAYVRHNRSAFGFVGLAHVTGLQQEFARLTSTEIAKANFHFIYIYDEPLNHSIDELNTIRAGYRDGTTALPLGITLIDGSNKTYDEIIKEVLSSINAKITAFNSLSEDLKKFPESVDNEKEKIATSVMITDTKLGLFNKSSELPKENTPTLDSLPARRYSNS